MSVRSSDGDASESFAFRVGASLFNVLRILGVLVWCVFWMSAAIVLSLVTFNRDIALRMARGGWAPGILRITGARLKVDPLPALDWSQPHIFVMNHQSMVDVPCAFAALPANLRFVAKHSLKYVPFLGWYMAMTGMIFIDRANRRRAVRSLALAGERIRAGANILVYPEGTRSADGRILPFKKGPFALAVEAGVPVVPVAVHGTGRVLPRGGVRFHPSDVRLKVGAPIETKGRSNGVERDALIHEVRSALVALHRSIGGPEPVPQDIAAVGVEGVAAAAR